MTLNEEEALLKKYMDGYLRKELDNIKTNYLHKKKDYVICIDGMKGTGKSTLALQMCRYVDPTFNIDRVHFKGADFLKNMKDIKEGQAILLDEAIISMLRRNAMASMNKKMMIGFNIFRKKAAFICLCIPSVKNVDMSIQKEHLFSLVHVANYKREKTRQLWKWYGRKRLHRLIEFKYDYGKVRGNKYGWFGDYRPFEKEYEGKKDANINAFLASVEEPSQVDKVKQMKETIIKNMMEKGLSLRQIGEYFGVTKGRISQIAKELKLSRV